MDRPDGDPLHIRRLHTLGEYQECVRIQEETWGKNCPDLVPPSILLVAQKIGGIVAGAFDSRGSMLGFSFAMTGFRDGVRILWSDMVAVRHAWRGRGIGKRMKLYQREEALKQGMERIFWTFDPLVARNACLNIVRLGARVDSYVPDMYIEGEGDLHRGLGMDRCVAVWDLRSPAVEAVAAGEQLERVPWPPEVPVVNAERREGNEIIPLLGALPDAPRVLIEIPADIHAVRDRSAGQARVWRESTRRAFLHYLEQRYRVEAFVGDPEGRIYYLLAR